MIPFWAAAKCNAVLPKLFVALILTPCRINISVICSSPKKTNHFIDYNSNLFIVMMSSLYWKKTRLNYHALQLNEWLHFRFGLLCLCYSFVTNGELHRHYLCEQCELFSELMKYKTHLIDDLVIDRINRLVESPLMNILNSTIW